MSEELKPCPFCGAGAAIEDKMPYANVTLWFAICTQCYVLGRAHASKDEAITAWNTRTTPSQGLNAATVEREWSLPDLRDLHTDVQRIRDHDLGNRRMRDLLQTTMDTLVAADVEYAALATDPHQHGAGSK